MLSLCFRPDEPGIMTPPPEQKKEDVTLSHSTMSSSIAADLNTLDQPNIDLQISLAQR